MTPAPAPTAAGHLARYIAEAPRRVDVAPVAEAAKMCLADWLAVAIGAVDEPAARTVRAAMVEGGDGPAVVLGGGRASPAVAALANGTSAHCLDFDDTHVGSLAHIGAPTWAAVLAIAPVVGAGGREMLAAFVTGFEAGACIGGQGRGEALSQRGVHATAVVGRFAAAAASAALLHLDEHQALNALGLAGTQAGGLTASFGTMAKPFHAGRAAMDGVLAATLAARGFTAAHDLLDRPEAFLAILAGARAAPVDTGDLGRRSQILENTFKPYASCLLTHPAIDAAHALCRELEAAALTPDAVVTVVARVNALAITLAGRTEVETDLQGKFSLAYCIALALLGHSVSPADFCEARRGDGAVRALAARVQLVADERMANTAAHLTAQTSAARTFEAHVPLALGNPGNPMGWADMRAKFDALVAPRLGAGAAALFDLTRGFERARTDDVVRALAAT